MNAPGEIRRNLSRWRIVVVWLLAATLVGCASNPAAPTPGARVDDQASTATRSAPKRITIAMAGDPPGMSTHINPAGTATPGLPELIGITNPGLSTVDSDGQRMPVLAASVPSTDAGTWIVRPDGSMQTTWTLRPGITWHDGAPFTTEDLVFAATVGRDPELSEFGNVAYSAVERIEATDPLTITVFWKRPLIDADGMFADFAEPLPVHILGPLYTEDKTRVRESTYWTTEFVGAGAFRVREFVPSSMVRLEAYAAYVLGRPKIDEIEVRFITSTPTLVANVLAGEINMTIGRGLSLEQGLTLRDQWREGTVTVGVLQSWIPIYPQLLDPTPAVVANPQFRRALTHAMDRQQMANDIQAGLVPVSDTIIAPNQPEYRDVESSIVRYAYDPQKAMQMIADLGYTKGPDGMFRDRAGEPLSVEIRFVTSVDTTRLLSLASADYWRRVGVDAQPLVIPPQRNQDREYRASFPSFELVNQPGGAAGVPGLLHSSGAPLPSNNYRASSGAYNRSRYMNPEYDALLERYSATIPVRERNQALAQIIHHLTDQALLIGTVFGLQPQATSNRITNTTVGKALGTLITTEAHRWDLE
jgi:peptide/nickel transport system substrate-binding protein